jgi:hypothetical protein
MIEALAVIGGYAVIFHFLAPFADEGWAYFKRFKEPTTEDLEWKAKEATIKWQKALMEEQKHD